jgi:hypothetical protein
MVASHHDDSRMAGSAAVRRVMAVAIHAWLGLRFISKTWLSLDVAELPA